MKRKYPENKTKKRFTFCIDKNISKLLDEYMLEKGIFNKSQFIEDLIRNELSNSP